MPITLTFLMFGDLRSATCQFLQYTISTKNDLIANYAQTMALHMSAADSGSPKIDEENASPAQDVSLIRGGPFYQVQHATRLLPSDRWNLGRRIILAIAVGWLPLVLLTLIYHPSSLRTLISDYRVNARLLIAVPVLLIGQVVMDSRFRMIVQHLRTAGFLDADNLAKLDTIISHVKRWRDSLWPELAIIVAVYTNLALIFSAHLHENRPWALAVDGTGHLLPAGWYFALVSQLVYMFLIGLSLWKWLLWCYFLFRLSRLHLLLIPTHPDGHAGIGFLGLSAMAIAPVAFSAAAAIGSNWRYAILAEGAHLVSFRLDAVVLLLVVIVVGIGPLIFFVPKLAAVRRQGILQYGTLGQLHSVGFHQKWIVHRAGHEDEFLAAPEVSTLTDYNSSYQSIESMQPFPIDKGAFLALGVSVALPLFPTVLAEIPLAEVLKGLLEAVK
jgi:hypothetical protein